jgi:hypothetical protein
MAVQRNEQRIERIVSGSWNAELTREGDNPVPHTVNVWRHGQPHLLIRTHEARAAGEILGAVVPVLVEMAEQAGRALEVNEAAFKKP